MLSPRARYCVLAPLRAVLGRQVASLPRLAARDRLGVVAFDAP